MAKTPEELYQEREKRLNDAVQLRVPDRVPIAPYCMFFPAKYSGLSCEEVMYDYDKMGEAMRKVVVDFDLDACINVLPLISLGPAMEILGERRFKWPGHGVPADSTYQYVEGEYMKADEYDAFLIDPTDYMLRTYIPRVFGTLEPLGMLPNIPGLLHHYMFEMFLPLVVTMPPVAQAMGAIARAGQESQKMIAKTMALNKEMAELGFPSLVGSVACAPFDYIGDFLRGTTGVMLDMYERPDKLLAAIDKMTPAAISTASMIAQQSGIPGVYIPLHKGGDGFMSPKQFETFYWPSLKRMIVALIEQGMLPLVNWEGDCTSRHHPGPYRLSGPPGRPAIQGRLRAPAQEGSAQTGRGNPASQPAYGRFQGDDQPAGCPLYCRPHQRKDCPGRSQTGGNPGGSHRRYQLQPGQY